MALVGPAAGFFRDAAVPIIVRMPGFLPLGRECGAEPLPVGIAVIDAATIGSSAPWLGAGRHAVRFLPLVTPGGCTGASAPFFPAMAGMTPPPMLVRQAVPVAPDLPFGPRWPGARMVDDAAPPALFPGARAKARNADVRRP